LRDSSARGIAWLPLPRENPSKLIFSPRRVDLMRHFAYASHMKRRQFEARVQRTHLCWMLARLDGYALQFNKRSTGDQSGKANIVPVTKNGSQAPLSPRPRAGLCGCPWARSMVQFRPTILFKCKWGSRHSWEETMPVSPACFNSSSESFSDQESMVKTRSSSFQQIDLMYGTPLSGLLTYYL
jgi:hypothetical protein